MAPTPLRGRRSRRAGDTRFQPPLILAADVASVQFSRTVKRRYAGRPARRYAERCDQGRRSLKTQQHAGPCAAASACRPQVAREGAPGGHPARLGRHARPDRRMPSASVASPRRAIALRALHDRGTVVLPRKEVIQPQLPLRLPCYDFTPVTSPTFDGSLPCGLGHRLRVLLTPVV